MDEEVVVGEMLDSLLNRRKLSCFLYLGQH